MRKAILVESNAAMADALVDALMLEGIDVVECFKDTSPCFRKVMLGEVTADLVVSEYSAGSVNGVELLDAMELLLPDAQRLLVCGEEEVLEGEVDYTVMRKQESTFFMDLRAWLTIIEREKV